MSCVMSFVLCASCVMRMLPYVYISVGLFYLFYVACIMPFLVHDGDER